jgi:hypothetical protein
LDFPVALVMFESTQLLPHNAGEIVREASRGPLGILALLLMLLPCMGWIFLRTATQKTKTRIGVAYAAVVLMFVSAVVLQFVRGAVIHPEAGNSPSCSVSGVASSSGDNSPASVSGCTDQSGGQAK